MTLTMWLKKKMKGEEIDPETLKFRIKPAALKKKVLEMYGKWYDVLFSKEGRLYEERAVDLLPTPDPINSIDPASHVLILLS